jgi:hypothetical protein
MEETTEHQLVTIEDPVPAEHRADAASTAALGAPADGAALGGAPLPLQEEGASDPAAELPAPARSASESSDREQQLDELTSPRAARQGSEEAAEATGGAEAAAEAAGGAAAVGGFDEAAQQLADEDEERQPSQALEPEQEQVQEQEEQQEREEEQEQSPPQQQASDHGQEEEALVFIADGPPAASLPLPAPPAPGAAPPPELLLLERPSAPEPSLFFVGGLRVRLCSPSSGMRHKHTAAPSLLCHSKTHTHTLATKQHPLHLPKIQHNQAIDVEVDCGPGVPCRLIHVDIDISDQRRPFLGGLRHRGSGATFHHAAAQTPPPGPPPPPPPPRACRETQTVARGSRGTQTLREASTQVARPGVVLDESGDRVVTANTYVTAREVVARREAAALTIQRHARGMAARRRAAALRARKAEREAFLEERGAKRAAALDAARRREVARRMHPTKPADFRVLESELEAWRRGEAARIKGAGLDAVKEQVGVVRISKGFLLLGGCLQAQVHVLHRSFTNRSMRRLTTITILMGMNEPTKPTPGGPAPAVGQGDPPAADNRPAAGQRQARGAGRTRARDSRGNGSAPDVGAQKRRQGAMCGSVWTTEFS